MADQTHLATVSW